MKKERPILWEATPKQAEFLSCPAREVLYGGSIGSGKSDAILISALSQVKNPKHRALILRKSVPQLRDLMGRSHELYLPLGGTFNKVTLQWTWPNGAIVEFGPLDSDEDKFRFLGRAVNTLCFDELTSWPSTGTDAQGNPVNAAYLWMTTTRLRAVEGSGCRLEIRASCNSSGPGHGWVRQRWNIPDDGGASEVIDPATGYRRVFIPARLADNQHLANTSYARSLEALPEASYKADVEGRWDVYEGGVFGSFNPRVHVCPPMAVPNEWPMWRGMDDGFRNPLCCLWLARSDATDTIIVTQELYRSGLTPQEAAGIILAMDGGRDLDGVIDSSAFADTGQVAGGGGRGDVLNMRGCNFKPAAKGVGSRLAGIDMIQRRLAPRKDGTPGLVIASTCRNLIRELQAAVYKAGTDDIDDGCSQHAIDALRYALLRRKPLAGGMVRLGSLDATGGYDEPQETAGRCRVHF